MQHNTYRTQKGMREKRGLQREAHTPSASQMAREATATTVLEWDGVVGGPQCHRDFCICATDTEEQLARATQLRCAPGLLALEPLCSTSGFSGTQELLKVAPACICHSTMLRGSVMWPCNPQVLELVIVSQFSLIVCPGASFQPLRLLWFPPLLKTKQKA